MKRINISIGSVLLILVLFSPVHMVNSNHQSNGIKNVILMIGDGMGAEHVSLGSYIETGVENGLFMQQFYKTNMTTYSADNEITDSAASATAMSTGYKTYNGFLSLVPDDNPVETILEYSQSLGHKTGVVSTANWYHATPAAFMVHQDSRYDYQEIIEQILVSNTDVVLGGGFHLSGLAPLTEFDSNIASENYTLIEDRSSLVNYSGSGKLFGSFGDGYLPYEADLDLETDVRLRHMTEIALDQLENDEGLFLMIESGRIDHAGHENSIIHDALEVIEFDYNIKLVYDWVQTHPDTLVIVTADHETGGLSIDSTTDLDSDLPHEGMTDQELRTRRISRVDQLSTSYSSSQHTPVDVPVFAFGKGADDILSQFNGVIDNTDIYRILKNAIDGVGLGDTSIDTISSSSETSVVQSSILNSTNTETPSFTVFSILIILLPIYIRRR